MKQKEVFKKIGAIIEELGEQYEYLKTISDELNDLELELFVANAHFLTDHVEVLCKLNLQRQAEKRTTEKAAKPEKIEKPDAPEKITTPETVKEPKYFEPVVQQMKPGAEKLSEKPSDEPVKPVEVEIASTEQPETSIVPEVDVVAAAPADSFSFIHEEPETIRHELILDESMELDDDETPEPDPEPVKEIRKRKSSFVAESTVTEPSNEKAEEPKQATDTTTIVVEEEVLTINQKISQSAEKNISRTEQIGIKPISDIKLAITLNDKLLYVKDLFNGYNLAYSEAVEILNRFSTFDEAARFLKTNYVTKNNWESKPATVEKFYALLKRRYA